MPSCGTLRGDACPVRTSSRRLYLGCGPACGIHGAEETGKGCRLLEEHSLLSERQIMYLVALL